MLSFNIGDNGVYLLHHLYLTCYPFLEGVLMVIRQFFPILVLLMLLTGCAEDYYYQPQPAPVYGGYPNHYPYPPQQPNIPKPAQPDSDRTVVTRPLREPRVSRPIEIKPEPVIRETEIPPSVSEEPPEIIRPAPKEQIAEPESKAETEFTPLESNAHLSAPVTALVLAARQNTASGNLEAAGSAIERAIRIEPRNATLYYKLAVVRLKQSQPRLAEDLAKKSALLASDNAELKKHSWLLIAKARELLGNPEGAKAAQKKANNFD